MYLNSGIFRDLGRLREGQLSRVTNTNCNSFFFFVYLNIILMLKVTSKKKRNWDLLKTTVTLDL